MSLMVFGQGHLHTASSLTGSVTVDESVREEDRSDDEEKDENVENIRACSGTFSAK